MPATNVSNPDAPAVVRAEAHSDDWAIQVKFDAERYLRTSSEEDIVELAACEWGGDYPGDYVATESESWEPRLSALFDYLKLADQGFECHVNEDDALRWLRDNRPEVLAAIEAKESTNA